MTKQDIIDYVVTTPHNPNKAVLSTMLDSFEVGDNKQEIELTATENTVYTPDEGKVYKKVTVNVPSSEGNISIANVIIRGEGSVTFHGLGGSTSGDVPVDGVMGREDMYYVYYEGLPLEQRDDYECEIIMTNSYNNPYFEIETEKTVVATGDVTIEDFGGGLYNIYITGDCIITMTESDS